MTYHTIPEGELIFWGRDSDLIAAMVAERQDANARLCVVLRRALALAGRLRTPEADNARDALRDMIRDATPNHHKLERWHDEAVEEIDR